MGPSFASDEPCLTLRLMADCCVGDMLQDTSGRSLLNPRHEVTRSMTAIMGVGVRTRQGWQGLHFRSPLILVLVCKLLNVTPSAPHMRALEVSRWWPCLGWTSSVS